MSQKLHLINSTLPVQLGLTGYTGAEVLRVSAGEGSEGIHPALLRPFGHQPVFSRIHPRNSESTIACPEIFPVDDPFLHESCGFFLPAGRKKWKMAGIRFEEGRNASFDSFYTLENPEDSDRRVPVKKRKERKPGDHIPRFSFPKCEVNCDYIAGYAPVPSSQATFTVEGACTLEFGSLRTTLVWSMQKLETPVVSAPTGSPLVV